MSRDQHDHTHAAVTEEDSELVLLERAVRELLIAKGLFTAADHRRQIDLMDSRNPMVGARLVARAWSDPAFRRRLLADAKAAAAETGINVADMPEIVVLENTPTRHHLVVCTLCSCYPKAILGMSPPWYKSAAYRARAVKDPRGVLGEFGTELAAGTEVRVVDSTADLRYMVLPMRPAGSESLNESELAALVTRDCMIGVTLPHSPKHR
jgi:nitrile hydratase alpha subunit